MGLDAFELSMSVTSASSVPPPNFNLSSNLMGSVLAADKDTEDPKCADGGPACHDCLCRGGCLKGGPFPDVGEMVDPTVKESLTDDEGLPVVAWVDEFGGVFPLRTGEYKTTWAGLTGHTKATQTIASLRAELEHVSACLAETRPALDDMHQLCINGAAEFGRVTAELEQALAERDAAFSMSKCECESSEACRNLAKLNHELEQARADAERKDDALNQLLQWAEACPLSVFPEPDFGRAHKALAVSGMTRDDISASCMRHVITQAESIILSGRQSEQEGGST